jgi:transposase
MSGDRTSPKFEVIASTRRRWRREQKLAILAEVDAPGGSVSEVARRHALHTSLLFRWRRELNWRRPSASASPAQSFVPVRLPPPSLPAPAAPAWRA